MAHCIDTQTGLLLHAYELGLLPEQERARFETHLIECDCCYDELSSFEQHIELLDDSEVNVVLEKALRGVSEPAPFLKRLWRLLWPDRSFVSKPAPAYALVLLLLMPSIYGLKQLLHTPTHIRPAQILSFSGTRAAEEPMIELSCGADIVLVFPVPEVTTGTELRLVIEAEDGREVLRLDEFRSIDEHGRGSIILPLAGMKPGNYVLTVRNPSPETALPPRHYPFRVIE